MGAAASAAGADAGTARVAGGCAIGCAAISGLPLLTGELGGFADPRSANSGSSIVSLADGGGAGAVTTASAARAAAADVAAAELAASLTSTGAASIKSCVWPFNISVAGADTRCAMTLFRFVEAAAWFTAGAEAAVRISACNAVAGCSSIAEGFSLAGCIVGCMAAAFSIAGAGGGALGVAGDTSTGGAACV